MDGHRRPIQQVPEGGVGQGEVHHIAQVWGALQPGLQEWGGEEGCGGHAGLDQGG